MRDDDRNPVPLPAAELAWSCEPDWIGFETTREVPGPCHEATGQREAIDALRLGIGLDAPGYNVYVAGPSGTGRTSTVRRVLAEAAASRPAPDDLCYVPGFDDPRSPRLLRLPPGKGRVLREALAEAQESLRQGLAALKASGSHRRRREAVARKFREEQARLLASFQEDVQQEGFALVEVSLGQVKRHEIAPVVDGQPVAFADLAALEAEGKVAPGDAERFRRRQPELAARLAETSGQLRDLSTRLQEALAEEDRAAARPLVDEVLRGIRRRVGIPEGEREAFDRFLAGAREFLLAVFPWMFATGETLPGGEGEEGQGPDPLSALRVHVLVDRTGATGAPVVEESHPTPTRLLGWLEVHEGPDGAPRADLGGIHPGALHRADGGFLVIHARDLLAVEGGWAALRRAMRSGVVEIATAGSEGPPPLAPEPAPVRVTVILVGTPSLRAALAEGDEEFDKLFKVVAQFEERVDLTRETARSWACFLARVVDEEGLLPFDAGAVGRALEHMVRVAGRRGKISTRFRLLVDLAREASWMAGEEGADLVRAEHVERALAARRRRHALVSQRVLESIRQGILRLDLSGRRPGQVNALAVIETGLERFGYPVRVTATVATGRSGIIDIEREAELSGEIHTKASLILGGFLRSRFAREFPLALTASLCFEQSYGGIEGDSASAAELIALLSALSGIPVRQDLAITGAIDQVGQVLAVGGVNEKVEGFWRVCRQAGLTGTQGVAVPASSVGALQLAPELLEDVRRGTFAVYAIDTVDDAVRVLLGAPLGEPGEDGEWPDGTVGQAAARRLAEMARALRDFGPAAPW